MTQEQREENKKINTQSAVSNLGLPECYGCEDLIRNGCLNLLCRKIADKTRRDAIRRRPNRSSR